MKKKRHENQRPQETFKRAPERMDERDSFRDGWTHFRTPPELRGK